MTNTIQQKLLAAGVKNLREFGYPAVTAETILTDKTYSAFFKTMLKDNLGNGVDREIKVLLSKIGEDR